ncbi:hypothetical protein MTO96_041569, partial [Rhipicephalus appendiculatus]
MKTLRKVIIHTSKKDAHFWLLRTELDSGQSFSVHTTAMVKTRVLKTAHVA